MNAPVRIAMWSGPRNISTAMLRSWGNRPDCAVCDEPLYAHYLVETGLQHPGREKILAHHDTDWRRVVCWLTGPVPHGKPVFYQKHMAHHLLTGIGRDWLSELTHAFLIRNPREMLTSLIEHWPEPTLEDTGLPQQVEIVNSVRRRTGRTPPIVDARDLLTQPQAMLERLCAALKVPFHEAMLRWPEGRDTDGVWAEHWYDSVLRSTGFQPYRPRNREVPANLRDLHQRCRVFYDRLYDQRLTVS